MDDYYRYEIPDKEVAYYRVYMNKEIKNVVTYHYNFCRECNNSVKTPTPLIPYKVNLSKYEIDRIKLELEEEKNGENLGPALYHISLGNKEYKNINKKYKVEADKNKDKKVTHREYGDFLLRKVEMK